MTGPAYQLDTVRFRYPSAGRAHSEWSLQDVTCSVREGEFLGIIGPNGSGKTSLLNLLARLARPQGGDIRLFGESLTRLAPVQMARTVGVVPQETPPAFSFTVAEVVLMGRFPHARREPHSWLASVGWETETDVRTAWSAMDETNVAGLANRAIDTLSGGERQRVWIARALTQEPRVLLLDEPTAHLDLHHQAELCRLLRRLNEQRALTVVLISHDLNLASQYCDRLLLLNHGCLIALGSPQEVLRADTLQRVYGCEVLVDAHPTSGLPRMTMPGRPGAW